MLSNKNWIQFVKLAVLGAVSPIALMGCPDIPGEVRTLRQYNTTEVRNNDGSYMIDRPYFYNQNNEVIFISGEKSSSNGVCRNFGHSLSLGGIKSGNYTYTWDVSEIGTLNEHAVTTTDVYPNTRIDFLACKASSSNPSTSNIPYPEERASLVSYDYPYAGEVTLDFPYVLRGESYDLYAAGKDAIPFTAINDPNGLCYYYGYGDAIEYFVDPSQSSYDYDTTAETTAQGTIAGFIPYSTSYYNTKINLITCAISNTKEGQNELVEKAKARATEKATTNVEFKDSKEVRPVAKMLPVEKLAELPKKTDTEENKFADDKSVDQPSVKK
jgi:hypothetical protein